LIKVEFKKSYIAILKYKVFDLFSQKATPFMANVLKNQGIESNVRL